MPWGTRWPPSTRRPGWSSALPRRPPPSAPPWQARLGPDCLYVHTTREALDGDWILFREEHSHAAEHRLCADQLADWIDRSPAIVFVDDEFSTGRTLINMVQQLRERYPRLGERRLAAASILSRVSPENQARLAEAGIACECLVRLEHQDYERMVTGIPVKEAAPPAQGPLPDLRTLYTAEPLPDPRRGVAVGCYTDCCRAAAEELLSRLREELPEETTVERAPTGDGTTLTISPLPSGGAHSLQEIYRENIASIVSIRGSKGDGMSLGTGVVMSEDGYIITNSHVIEGCGAVDVVLQDERVFQALLVGQDAQSDLAVLKIDCAGLTPAQFGDSTLLEVGDAVAAIGNPLGEELRGTMTDGIISAINRDVNVDGYTMVLLQTTAALNSGNSGGALINDRGQVVGITNLKMRAYDNTVEGLGFAIPTTTVKTVVDALIAHGRVEGRPTIGITGYTVTEELAEEYGCPRGVAVQSVREGSDAQRQGVLPNDVIVAVNGETITDMDQLQAIKEGLAVGDVLTFRLWRGGHYLERDVALVDQYTLEE